MKGEGEPGLPGEPGEPGEPGIGGGGHGGHGGRGGAGGAASQIKRWKALLAYVFFVIVSVSVAIGYTHNIREDLNHHDRISCLQRQVLARNQIDVLDALIFVSKTRTPLLPKVTSVQQLTMDRDRLQIALHAGC